MKLKSPDMQSKAWDIIKLLEMVSQLVTFNFHQSPNQSVGLWR